MGGKMKGLGIVIVVIALIINLFGLVTLISSYTEADITFAFGVLTLGGLFMISGFVLVVGGVLHKELQKLNGLDSLARVNRNIVATLENINNKLNSESHTSNKDKDPKLDSTIKKLTKSTTIFSEAHLLDKDGTNLSNEEIEERKAQLLKQFNETEDESTKKIYAQKLVEMGFLYYKRFC
jgi:predicted negative regulator of RcsB-dependent stress response